MILSYVPLMDDGAPYTLCEFSMFLFGGFVCFCFVFFLLSHSLYKAILMKFKLFRKRLVQWGVEGSVTVAENF